jgi:hypothetical protein
MKPSEWKPQPEINLAVLPVPSRPPRATFILDGVKPMPGWFAEDFATSSHPFSFWVLEGGERTLISSYSEWVEFCKMHPGTLDAGELEVD